MTRYSVYADLSRPLLKHERSAVFDALELLVPDSGCVGVHHGPADEVYFSVEAALDQEANVIAREYLRSVLRHAGLDVSFSIEVRA